MSGWGHGAQCDAVDPAGNRCVLWEGHSGSHGVAPARPRPIAFVVAIIVLIVGEIANLLTTFVAYYGLGGATSTPGPVFGVMWLGLIVLPVGMALSWMQRRRAAIACVVLLLLQVPVGLLALGQSGWSGDPAADVMSILVFAIPGLLLTGYLWVQPRLHRGVQSTPASTPPFG
jgi:hypothetical protein